MNEPEQLAQRCAQLLLQYKVKLVTAESCTGGWVGQVLTSIAGSSQWYERGFITYSNEAKQVCLGVKNETLEQHGAVSENVASEMAQGAIQHSLAQHSIAVTGVAGPDGGTSAKPVGTVYIAWANVDTAVITQLFHFQGDRTQIRCQAVTEALRGLIRSLETES